MFPHIFLEKGNKKTKLMEKEKDLIQLNLVIFLNFYKKIVTIFCFSVLSVGCILAVIFNL